MIPEFVDIRGPWKVLPAGKYLATLDEVRDRYAINDRRTKLFMGLVDVCTALKSAGCKNIYLDGSFISDKPNPGDFDLCWDPSGVDINKLDPVLLDFSEKRKNQKLKFGGECFPSSSKANGTNTFIEFFEIEKYTGLKKGIICIHLQ